jgi:superfamily II DNA or RNA helicase
MECIKFGALVPPCTFAPDEPDLKKIKNYKVGVDLTEQQQIQAIMRPGVVDRVIGAWKTHNPDGLPSLGFGPDVKGSLYFAEEFLKAGIPSAHIDGENVWIKGQFYDSSPETRQMVADMSMDGDVKIVWNRYVLREGIDWPWIACGSFACCFGSLTSFLQSGGRLLRAYPGKDCAIILDHGGNWHRHGSLAETRSWELGQTNVKAVSMREDRMREHKLPEPITCPECHRTRAGGKVCQNCGYQARIKSRVVVQANGTLRHIEGDIYKSRHRVLKDDTAELWQRMYHRAKSKKWDATFKAAEALFVQEHHHWPPRDLPLMPKNHDDWFRKVSDVPREALL